MKEEKKRKTSVRLLIVSVKKRSFTLKLSLYMEMIVDCMLQMWKTRLIFHNAGLPFMHVRTTLYSFFVWKILHIYLSDLICQGIFFTHSDIIQPSDNWFNLQNGYKIWWNIFSECGGNNLSMIRLRHIINNSDDFKEFIKSHFWEFERLHGWVTEIWSVCCIVCIPHLIKFWMEKFLFVFQFLFIQDIWAQLEVSRFIRKSPRLIHQTCKTEKKN